MLRKVKVEYNESSVAVSVLGRKSEAYQPLYGLEFLNGKSIKDWFMPVVVDDVIQWTGFAVAIEDAVGGNELAYEFVGDAKSEEIFFDCLNHKSIDPKELAKKYYEMATIYKKERARNVMNEKIVYYNEPSTLAKMLQLLRLAANLGHVDAQYTLACCLPKKEGFCAESVESFQNYEKAVAQGHVGAHIGLGANYWLGVGVEKNEKKGIALMDKANELWEAAAQNGDAEAQVNLGVSYYYGISGVKTDVEKGKAWFQKAAEQGNERAKSELDKMNR